MICTCICSEKIASAFGLHAGGQEGLRRLPFSLGRGLLTRISELGWKLCLWWLFGPCLLCPLKWLQVSHWVNPACLGCRGDASLTGTWGKNLQRTVYKWALSCLPGHGTWGSCHVLGSEVPTGGMLHSHHSNLHPSLGETLRGVHGPTGTPCSEGRHRLSQGGNHPVRLGAAPARPRFGVFNPRQCAGSALCSMPSA